MLGLPAPSPAPAPPATPAPSAPAPRTPPAPCRTPGRYNGATPAPCDRAPPAPAAAPAPPSAPPRGGRRSGGRQRQRGKPNGRGDLGADRSRPIGRHNRDDRQTPNGRSSGLRKDGSCHVSTPVHFTCVPHSMQSAQTEIGRRGLEKVTEAETVCSPLQPLRRAQAAAAPLASFRFFLTRARSCRLPSRSADFDAPNSSH